MKLAPANDPKHEQIEAASEMIFQTVARRDEEVRL